MCEVYSPPRAAAAAAQVGLLGGWSLALTTEDHRGVPWDFDKVEVRARCRTLLKETKPILLVGSPLCTWFSTLQAMSRKKMDPATWAKERVRALMHWNFTFELYEMQVMGGALLCP